MKIYKIGLYASTFFLVSMVYTTQAVAASWECRKHLGHEPIVRVWAEPDSNAGTLEANGITKDAWYRQEGFDHRWDLDLDESDGIDAVTFIIELDGSGKYYHFGEEKNVQSPTLYTQCTKTE